MIWANAVLTPVDHLLGSGLGLGAFVRYCDDVLVYAEDRRRLEDAWRRVRDLADRLRLRLHPDKCRHHRTTERVGFVGFVLERHGGRVAVHLACGNGRTTPTRKLVSTRTCFTPPYTTDGSPRRWPPTRHHRGAPARRPSRWERPLATNRRGAAASARHARTVGRRCSIRAW